MKLEPGTAIGSFVLERKLGQGGFGAVWAGRHREWKDRVDAFKFPADERLLDRLRAEGEALRALDHPNIVHVHDLDTASDPPFIRMEYVEGESLRQRLERDGRLHPREALAVFRRLLDALAHAHGRGVVHCDVKPGNVLLAADGTVKLADFGVAAVTSEISRELSVSLDAPDSDDALRFAGTLDYMAPEVKHGAPPTPAADVYSLGVVLYRMLSGRLPESLKPPSHFQPDVPVDADRLVARMLDPVEERYPDAAAVLADLDTDGGADEPGPRWRDRWYPAGELLFALAVVACAASLANVRLFAAAVMWPVALLLVAAVALAGRLSRGPVLAACFWGGLALAVMGGRMHWTVLWLGLAAALTAAVIWIALQAARGKGGGP